MKVHSEGFVHIKTCLNFLFFIFVLILLIPSWVWSGNGKRIMVFPFEVMAGEDLAYMGKGVGRMLCTRIGGEEVVESLCMENYPREYGIKDDGWGDQEPPKLFQDVDFLLTGSITVLGNRISTDARLMALKGEKKAFQFHEDGTVLGDVMTHAENVALKVKSIVTGRKISRVPAALPVMENHKKDYISPSSPTPLSSPLKKSVTDAKISDLVLPSTETGADLPGARVLPSRIPTVSTPLFHSRELDGEIRGIAVSDLDGDHHPELAVMFKNKVTVFSVQAGKLVKQTEFSGKSINANLAIDAGDMDGDGQEELYITCVDKNSRLRSFVLVWKSGSFELMAQDLPWFFRMVKHDGRIKLAGQAQGMNNFFSGRIHFLTFRNGKIHAEKKADFSHDLKLYGFNMGEFFGNGKEQLAWLDDNNRLNIAGDNVHEDFKGSDSLGSTLLFLDGKSDGFMGDENGEEDGMSRRVFLSQRILTQDLDGRIGDELVTIVNKDFSRGFFARFRKFDSGYVKVLTWKGGRVVTLCSTPETAGYIPDFDVEDMDGDGFSDLIFVVVKKKSLSFGKIKSVIEIESLVAKEQ